MSGPDNDAVHAFRSAHNRAGRTGTHLIVIEVRSRDHAKAHISETRSIAVALLRLRLTIRQITSESRLRSVNRAGGTTSFRTSNLPSIAGSLNSGDSIRSSILRPPSRDQIRSYSSNACSCVGCDSHSNPRCARIRDRPRQPARSDRASCRHSRAGTRHALVRPYFRRVLKAASTAPRRPRARR